MVVWGKNSGAVFCHSIVKLAFYPRVRGKRPSEIEKT